MMSRIIRAFVAAMVGAAICVVGVAGVAHAANLQVDPNRYFEIVPFYYSYTPQRCMDVANGSPDSGTTIQVYRCHGYDSNGAPQMFRFVPWPVYGRTHTYQISPASSNNKCIDDPYEAPYPVVQVPCTGETVWELIQDPLDPNGFQIYDFAHDTCITTLKVQNNNYDRQPLMAVACSTSQWPDDAGRSQDWVLG